MSYEKYKIGQVSNLLGLTPEALRYYEREGIIAPEKSSYSGYRYYSAWDIHILIRARSMRQFGFTLEETIDALNQEDLEATVELLKNQEQVLEDEIKKAEQRLEQLRHVGYSVHDTLLNLGKYRIEYRPAMHFIDVQRGYSIGSDKFELYKRWIEEVPFVMSGGIFEMRQEEDLVHYGLLIEDDCIEGLSHEDLAETKALPSQKSLTTFFQSGSQHILCKDMFTPAIKFLEERGLELSGDPVARAVLMKRKKDGNYLSWYQGWVPFEGDIEYGLPPKR